MTSPRLGGCVCPGVTGSCPRLGFRPSSPRGKIKTTPLPPPQSARRGLYGGHAALPPPPPPRPLSRGPSHPWAPPTRAPTGVPSLPPGDRLMNIMHVSNSSERSSLSSPSGVFPAWNISRGGISPRFPLPSPCTGTSSGAGSGGAKGAVGGDKLGGPAGTTGDLAWCACRGRMRAAFSRSFDVEGAVGIMMGIMASCFLSMGRWLLCALAEGDCRRGNVPLALSF